MNCQDFERILPDVARKQMMEAGLRRAAMAHAENCAACAFKLEEQVALCIGLQALAAEVKSIEAPDHIERQLLAGFREQAGSSARPGYIRPWAYAATAAAAVLLLVFVIVAMQSRKPANAPVMADAGKDVVDVAANDSLPPVAQVTEQAKPNKKLTSPRASRSRAKSIASKVATQTASAPDAQVTEVTSAFMPLRYVSASNLQDGGQVVRVEMSRAAMASLGVPVNMDRYGERVKADVVLGVDGLARAIRFVQ